MRTDPWTSRVDNRVERPARTHFSERRLFSPDNIENDLRRIGAHAPRRAD